jgi:basic amino acid/polyamine antiporter, APA family
VPHRRRRQQQGLERVLGTPALFSTAYGNVGSSIYYALGVTAVYALGLTPIVFVIAGLIFACTAATYAEGTVLYPEAGGSSSFARHAFNELVSFGAAWAQMLNYMATIAVSAFFVPHYLSIFWGPLKANPWDIVGGAAVILILVAINIVGVKEAARLNIVLAVIDFATQLLLVLIGFVLVFSPHVLISNVHLGVAPTWSQFFLAIPVAMLAYTGIETVSNMAEEAREPRRTIPRAVTFVAVAVFAIYFTLPLIALSAMPVEFVNGHYQTVLGLPPEQGGFANDPVLGLVENLGLHGVLLSSAKLYVGVLAATILFIGANAGVIGASRITYAMAGYRQLPQAFHRIHPRFRTPWLSLVVFAGLIPIGMTLPGQTNFLGTIYSFGATLSFTVAHSAVIALRVRRKEGEAVYEARPNRRIRGINWPLFALVGGLGTGLSWLVIVIQSPSTRYAGLGWLAIGFAFYYVYRRRVLHQPLTKTIRAPVEVVGPSLAVEYRTVVVPVKRTGESEEALVAAARLAADRGATVAIVHVIEVPLSLPADARLAAEQDEAEQLLDDAQALVESYGVRAVTRLLRARRAGPAIVEEARRRDAELVVLGAPRHAIAGRRRLFGGTVDYVLREAPCRVLVVAGKAKAA